MATQEHHHTSQLLTWLAIPALCLILLATTFFLVEDVHAILVADGFLPARTVARAVLHHIPIQLPEIADIQSWMTFDYLNRVFNLPPNYLRETLQIQSVQYPRLSIRGLAKEQNTSGGVTTVLVQNAIRTYQMTHSATSTH